MQLRPIAIFDDIDPEIFKRDFYEPGTPVVIKNLAKQWPAYSKWNWDYFKKLVGDKKSSSLQQCEERCIYSH